jgi:histidinol dehydrogenase
MTEPRWFARGELASLSRVTIQTLMDRGTADNDLVVRATSEIVDDVRRRGDQALREQAMRFDGVSLDALEVPLMRAHDALDSLPGDVRRALKHAARNIEEVHRAFLPGSTEITTRDRVVITRRADPVARAGVYAPGGRAAYPSSVLMGVVPARVAGVREIVVCSPPDISGSPSAVVLAAAALGGATRIFAAGGAGAIGAMAYGTQTIPRVDRIVGPGNAYVAAAKQMVAHVVGIDSPAGPSELLIIADGTTSVDAAAREVLAQAEHDPAASVVVLSTARRWADELAARVLDLIAGEPRADIIAESIRNRGAVVSFTNVDGAIAFAAEFAPEHLLLLTADAAADAVKVRNAGSVFIGETSSVAFGDYMTGANHVLPTAGLARMYSGLSTNDFIRWMTLQHVSRDASRTLAGDTAALAFAERLPAHAAAAMQWSGA